MKSETYKLTVPLFIVSILGTVMILEYFFSFLNPIIIYTDTLRSYATVISSAAIGVGTALLVILHSRRIYAKSDTPHWSYSIIFFIFFLATFLSGLLKGVRSDTFLWMFNYIQQPTGQAYYSCTAFYITTAAYRVFRFRNLDASVLLASGMLAMWAVLPLFTGSVPFIVPIFTWMNNTLVMAGYRAFGIGLALGTIGLGVRIFLHKHKEVLG